MSVTQSRLADLARWLASSSKPRHMAFTETPVGRYVCIVPCYFDEAPPIDFEAETLPLFVSMEHAEGVKTGPIVAAAPPSQDRARERLAHIVWKIGTDLPAMAIVGLDDPQEPISAAVERSNAAGVTSPDSGSSDPHVGIHGRGTRHALPAGDPARLNPAAIFQRRDIRRISARLCGSPGRYPTAGRASTLRAT